MADDVKSSWTFENVRDLIRDIGATVAIVLSAWNNVKLGHVQTQQDSQSEKAQVVKDKLEETTANTQASLDKIKTATKIVEDTLGPQLWITWKRLEETSFETNAPADIEAAAKAKEAYLKYSRRPKE